MLLQRLGLVPHPTLLKPQPLHGVVEIRAGKLQVVNQFQLVLGTVWQILDERDHFSYRAVESRQYLVSEGVRLR